MPNETFIQQRRFGGLNTFIAPQDMGPSDLRQSDNLVNYGGEMYTRSGFQAVFATALGAAIYASVEFVRADGSTVILFVSNGKLYFTVKGTVPMTYTEILIGGVSSFSLSSANTRIYHEGKYAYIVDGVVSLYRVNVNADNSYTAVAVTGLSVPSSAPNASLSYTTIDSLNTTAGWSADFIAPASTTFTVNGATNASPIVAATSSAHGLTIGDVVYISGVGGNTAANGCWRVGTVADSTHAQLLYMDGTNSSGNGAFSSSGTLIRLGTTSTLSFGIGTNLLPQNGNLTSMTTSGGNWQSGGGWTVTSPQVGDTTSFGLASAMQFDVIGDGILLNTAIPNYVLASDTTRYATHAYVGADGYTDVSNEALNVDVSAYSDTAGTVLLSTRTINFKLASGLAGVAQHLAGVVSFADVVTPIRSWKLKYYGATGNHGSGSSGAQYPGFKAFVFYPWCGNGDGSTSPGAEFGTTSSQLSVNAMPAASFNLSPTIEYIGAHHLIHDFYATGATSTAITAATNASPSQVTAAGHGLATNDYVAVRGVLGNTAVNGIFQVTKVDNNNVTLNGSTGNAAYISGGTITKLSVKDLSLTSFVSITWKQLMTFTPTDFSFRIGLRNTSGITYSILAVLSADGTYWSADISGLSTAQRQNIGAIEIVPVTDLAVSGAVKPLFAMGPLTSAGNLTVGSGSYVYVITEAQDTSKDTSGVSTGITDDGVVESNPSKTSVIITPTALEAETSMIFPAFTNSAANYFYVYRLGGPFSASDPIATYRLIAKLPRWSDTIDTSSAGSGYCTWNHSTLTFTDNTPDGALVALIPTLASGHDAPPTGATCVSGWRGRVALGKGATLYVSTVLTTDAAAALYYPAVNVPNDPASDVKGWIAPINPNDNDKILNIVESGDWLLIFKSKSISIMGGDTPNNISISHHLRKAGIGLSAAAAVAIVEGAAWILGINAVWAYSGGETPSKVSLKVEPSIFPQTQGNTPVPSSVRNGSVVCYSAQRFYLATGGSPTSTGNDTLWVFDARESPSGGSIGWTRFYPPAGKTITSICSMSAIGDTDDLFFGMSDGQMYRFTGTSDVTSIATVSGATNATPIVVTTSTNHGYADGDRVVNRDIGGNTAANGTFYAKRTGYSNTTFGLYSDSGLTSAVAGNGAYTSGGATGKATAISWALKCRGMGQEQGGESWFTTNRPTRALALFTANESTSVTLLCESIGSPASSSITHTAPSGVNQIRDKVSSDVRGNAIYTTLSGSSYLQFKVTSMAVESAEGAIKGNT